MLYKLLWYDYFSAYNVLHLNTGGYKVTEIDKLSLKLWKEYGDIVKIEKLLGRPDMVFLYDADEIEKVFRNEELMPHRPSMPSLNYYKHVLRKDFFGELAGVIAVYVYHVIIIFLPRKFGLFVRYLYLHSVAYNSILA